MSVNAGRGKGPRPIWLIAGGAAVLAGAVAWPAGQGGWAAMLVAVGVLLPVAAFLVDLAAARSGDLGMDQVADRLADLVRTWAELQRQAAGRRSRAGAIADHRILSRRSTWNLLATRKIGQSLIGETHEIRGKIVLQIFPD